MPTEDPENNEFGRLLRSLREARNVTQRELCRMIGIQETYIGQLERGDKPPPRRANLELIGAALGLSRQELAHLFVTANRPLPPGWMSESKRVPFATYVRQDPDLTDDQRATLISVYDEFVRHNRRWSGGRPPST